MFGSMFHSFVLAQVLGLYLVLLAIILLSRVKFYRNFVQNMKLPNSGAIIGSSLGLLLGLVLVVIHNIWVPEPRVMITVLGWLILIKSILWLAFPEKALELSKKLYSGPGYYIVVLIIGVVGVLLMSKGFYLPMTA